MYTRILWKGGCLQTYLYICNGCRFAKLHLVSTPQYWVQMHCNSSGCFNKIVTNTYTNWFWCPISQSCNTTFVLSNKTNRYLWWYWYCCFCFCCSLFKEGTKEVASAQKVSFLQASLLATLIRRILHGGAVIGFLLVSQGSLGLIGFPGVARPTAFTEILSIAEIWEIYPSIAIPKIKHWLIQPYIQQKTQKVESD